eukprot:GHVQ01014191.1.p1 GENE.GHVQ01014191.1~~GHVQ01014191.1.p1  ORF type:complete len:820 (-),score=56.99 GHVQ01014191.1:240-2699(-)
MEKLSAQYIQPLLKLNDELRKLTKLEDDINATTIVALGDQSHGKSSVIEALSGIDLPRGEGIKTRLPLVLYLRQLESDNREEYALIKAEGYYERRILLHEVSQYVEECTEVLAGGEKNVKDYEIELTVYRAEQDELTLIDLPGLTRLAAKGQDTTIEETITKMYERYIKPEEAVLLNVVSAMVDVSTSASLKMCRKIDPEGQRTLLCFTKVDQYKDSGLSRKLLEPTELFDIPQEHIFCVKNRSQAENDSAVDLCAARENESNFFKLHDELRELPDAMCGVQAVSKCLVMIQRQRIISTLPNTRDIVQKRLKELETQLSAFTQYPTTLAESQIVLHRLIDCAALQLFDQKNGNIRLRADDENVGEQFELSVEMPKVREIEPERRFGKSKPKIALNCTWEIQFQHVTSDIPGASGCYWFALVCSPLGSEGCKHVEFECFYECTFESKIVTTQESAAVSTAKFQCSAQFADSDTTTTVRVDAMLKQDVIKEETLLCAKFGERKRNFGKAFAELKPKNFFFSNYFLKRLSEAIKAREGCEGLPGTIPSDIAVWEIRRLQEETFGTADKFAREAHLKIKDIIITIVSEPFKAFPQLHTYIRGTVQRLSDATLDQMLQDIKLVKDLEYEIDTENHYYMDSVRAIQKLMLKAEAENKEADFTVLDRFSIAKLKGFSNRNQTRVDLVIQTLAYWKLMRKRFVDNVILCAKRHLCSDRMIHNLKDQLMEECYALQDKLLHLMSPCVSDQSRREQIQSRIDKLNQAMEKISTELMPEFVYKSNHTSAKHAIGTNITSPPYLTRRYLEQAVGAGKRNGHQQVTTTIPKT